MGAAAHLLFMRQPQITGVTSRVLAVIALACLLSGCAASMEAVVGTLRTAVRGEPGADAARLNPNFRYLRATVGSRVAFLALGNVESDPRGPVEVWYSAQKEVLRLQNGRLVGVVGLTTEWRAVALPDLPAWSAVARSGEPVRWIRTRDLMPGYRYGVRDTLVLRAVAPPERTALLGRDPRSLSWFEERLADEPAGRTVATLLATPSEDLTLPPARYAVELREGGETVVYGEQCLARELCFTWQRWNAKLPDGQDLRK